MQQSNVGCNLSKVPSSLIHINNQQIVVKIFICNSLFITLCFSEDSKTLKCCTDDNQLIQLSELPGDCLPMAVSPNDPFFCQFNVKCLDFARARLSDNGTCSFFPIEQVIPAWRHYPVEYRSLFVKDIEFYYYYKLGMPNSIHNPTNRY